MTDDHQNIQVRQRLTFDLEDIIHESEALIAEFQKLIQETDSKAYSVFRFFRKDRNADTHIRFRDIDNRLGNMVLRLNRFSAANVSDLSIPTQAYIQAYGEYLESVKSSAEFRVEFEFRFGNLSSSTSSLNDVDRTKELMVMISTSLEANEKKAHKVNAALQSFRNQSQ